MKNEKYVHLNWIETKREKVTDCHIFDYYKVDRVGPDGQEGTFTLLDAPNWVTVVAPVEQHGVEGFLMVRQFRHGSGTIVLEFPAGVIEPGEQPVEAAKRELEEETGWQAEQLVPLGSVSPNPAFLNNRSYFFVAQQLRKKGMQHLDPMEALDALFIPQTEIEAQIGKGEFDNGIMVIAWHLYLKWKGGNQ